MNPTEKGGKGQQEGDVPETVISMSWTIESGNVGSVNEEVDRSNAYHIETNDYNAANQEKGKCNDNQSNSKNS